MIVMEYRTASGRREESINNVLQSPETTVRGKKRKTLSIRFLFRFLLLAVISLSQPLIRFDKDKNKRNKKNEKKKTKIIKKKKRSTQKRKKKKPSGGSKLIKRKK